MRFSRRSRSFGGRRYGYGHRRSSLRRGKTKRQYWASRGGIRL